MPEPNLAALAVSITINGMHRCFEAEAQKCANNVFGDFDVIVGFSPQHTCATNQEQSVYVHIKAIAGRQSYPAGPLETWYGLSQLLACQVSQLTKSRVWATYEDTVSNGYTWYPLEKEPAA